MKQYLKTHYKCILLFIVSWKAFLTKLFLCHWKRNMIIYVLSYFGCIILVLILKPRHGTQPLASVALRLPREDLPLPPCPSQGRPSLSLPPSFSCATIILGAHSSAQPAPGRLWSRLRARLLLAYLHRTDGFLPRWDMFFCSRQKWNWEFTHEKQQSSPESV